MSNNMAKIADARKTVEQLKLEVNIERMMVSQHINYGKHIARLLHMNKPYVFEHTVKIKI